MRRFTFQYGQIYYRSGYIPLDLQYAIYIPIWLDLLSTENREIYAQGTEDLHSNMVRFIIQMLLYIIK